MGLTAIHTQLCRHRGGLTKRHNRVRNYLYLKYKRAGFECEKEKYGVCLNLMKPADIWVKDFHDGKDGALDISITCPLSKVQIKKKHHKKYDASYNAIKVKMKHYEQAVDEASIQFEPLIWESFGGMPPTTQKEILNLANDLRHIERRSETDIYNHR